MTMLRSPLTIVASQAGITDPNVKITGYDTTTGTISGKNFGALTGTVYLLNRDTHTYTSLSVAGWNNTGIALTNPIDLSTIEGTTCFFVRTSKGANSNKYVITGNIAVTGWGIIYYQNPKTLAITKYYMGASGEMDYLVGTSSYNYFYGKSIPIGVEMVHSSHIVGVQFGTSVSSYTIPAYFLNGLINLDQPVVLTSGMTLGSSASYFMYNCRSFNSPLILQGTNKTRFGNYFMGKCYSFNQPLDLSMVKYWTQTYFLWNCMAFNNDLELTTGVNASSRSFGGNFMNNCVSFNQPLTLPANINQITNGFMYGATAFNQPIEFPSSIAAIGTYFMANCYAFNRPIDLSACSFTSVGNYFLYMAKAFNSTLKLPTACTALGTYFLAGMTGPSSSIYTNMLYGCSFNQPLDTSKIKTFGNYFMANQLSFNQTISLASCTTIGTFFMQNCTSFAQPMTIPSTVTSIGTSFMLNIIPARVMTIETTTVPANTALTITSITATAAPTQLDTSVPAYSQGITLYGSQRSGWLTGLPNSSSSPWRNLIDGNS